MIDEDLVVNVSVFILRPTHSGIHDVLTADGLDAALDMLRCSSSTFLIYDFSGTVAFQEIDVIGGALQVESGLGRVCANQV